MCTTKSPYVLSFALALSMGACSSGYEPYGLKGGYTQRKVDPDTTLVEFKGNSFTTLQEAKALAFKRASEICHNHLDVREEKQNIIVVHDYEEDECFEDVKGNTFCLEEVTEQGAFSRPVVSLLVSCHPDSVSSIGSL